MRPYVPDDGSMSIVGNDIPSGKVGREGTSSFDIFGRSSHRSCNAAIVSLDPSLHSRRKSKQSSALAAAAFIACFLVSFK